MRILTILSGILLAAGGGFCYYFSTNPFSTLAFVLGAIMVVSGGFILLTYLLGLRNPIKLPETVFVEGLVTLLFGFAVLNNQISEPMLTIFFGTWLTLAGATRLSQSFSISRHNPKDWAKIIPFAIISIAGGVVLLMQNLVEAYNPVALVGTAFLVNALSQLLYALYMRPHTPRKRELAAKARAEAKENAEIQKRIEKDELRKMSKEERLAMEEKQKAEREAELAALREADARALAEAEANPAGKPATSDTISLSPEEVDEIRQQTDDAYEEELAKANENGTEDPADEKEAEVRPVWHRPTDIPSLRGEIIEDENPDPAAEQESEEPKIAVVSAVNLEELEGEKEVTFEKIDLPEPEYMAKGGEAAKRQEFLEELDRAEKARVQDGTFTAISLEELAGEKVEKSVTDEEKNAVEERLTAEFSFHWPSNPSQDGTESSGETKK